MSRSVLFAFAVLSLMAAAPDEWLPRTSPMEPPEAIKSFRVLDGFRLDLLAAEPLITDPVAAAYDEDGRLFVVEMTDYPRVEPANDKPSTENVGDPPVGRSPPEGRSIRPRTWRSADALLDSVQAGTISPLLIPPSRRALLLKDRDLAIRARAEALLGGETPAPHAHAARLRKWPT
jgi:hypothetical protein